jgi:hypothetical protein
MGHLSYYYSNPTYAACIQREPAQSTKKNTPRPVGFKYLPGIPSAGSDRANPKFQISLKSKGHPHVLLWSDSIVALVIATKRYIEMLC